MSLTLRAETLHACENITLLPSVDPRLGRLVCVGLSRVVGRRQFAEVAIKMEGNSSAPVSLHLMHCAKEKLNRMGCWLKCQICGTVELAGFV